jgi:SAM-dependent methyltransferase
MSENHAPRKAAGYLHGYSREEQDRLYHQARFMEPFIYDTVDFSQQAKVIEIGCGVGAQTRILLDRFPHLQVHGVDLSAEQLGRAREYLAPELRSGRAELTQVDASGLPFPDGSFDGAYVCWLLEHVADPVSILKEARRVLRRAGVIYCSEVLNATLYLNPYSPATLKYWFEFNDHQWSLGGDPYSGAKLGNHLLAAGFDRIETRLKTHHFDNRDVARRSEAIDYWTRLLLSGAPELLRAGKITQANIDAMTSELETLKTHPDAVLFFGWMQARAVRY